MADKMMMYKYIIKNVALRHGKTVTFMPKPLFGDNGSGMHTHQSLWKGGQPLFAGDEYAGLSELWPVLHRRHFETCPGALRFRGPDHQLLQTPGARLRGPVNLAYSSRNRSAAIRIPVYSPAPRPSASKSASPIPPAIRTWPSRRC